MKKIELSWRDISKYRSEIMGISIIGILFCHLMESQVVQGVEVTKLARLLQKGTAFVDLFLLVSGIGCYYSFFQDDDLIRFYKKRMLRVLPIYIMITLPYWIWRDVIIDGLEFGDVLKDISFYSFVTAGVERFWFVFAILICYALFPLIYRLVYMSRHTKRNAILMIIMWIIISVVIMLLLPQTYQHMKKVIDRVPAFFLGTYLGKRVYAGIKVKKQELSTLMALCIITQMLAHCGMTIKIHTHICYYTNTILSMCMLFVLIIFLKYVPSKLIRRVTSWLGSITMEIYLFHSLIKNVSNYPSSIVDYIVLCVILPVACAYLSHLCINRLMNRGNKNESI